MFKQIGDIACISPSFFHTMWWLNNERQLIWNSFKTNIINIYIWNKQGILCFNLVQTYYIFCPYIISFFIYFVEEQQLIICFAHFNSPFNIYNEYKHISFKLIFYTHRNRKMWINLRYIHGLSRREDSITSIENNRAVYKLPTLL